MTRGDLDAVAAVERISFSSPWSRESFRRLLSRPDTDLFVAEIDGRIAAYAVLWYAGDEAELGNLAVSPTDRRRGLGARLLDRAIECARARGTRRLFLEVRRSNVAAERLYRSRAFQAVGVRPRYYHRPVEDALVLRLDLGGAR
jgi:ribosomal-protein-alanine N-acetyltransferase